MGDVYEAGRDRSERSILTLLLTLFSLLTDEQLIAILRWLRDTFDESDAQTVRSYLPSIDERPGARAFVASLLKAGIEDTSSEAGDAYFGLSAVLMNMPTQHQSDKYLSFVARRLDMLMRDEDPPRTAAEYEQNIKQARQQMFARGEDESPIGVISKVASSIRGALGARSSSNSSTSRFVALVNANETGTLSAAFVDPRPAVTTMTGYGAGGTAYSSRFLRWGAALARLAQQGLGYLGAVNPLAASARLTKRQLVALATTNDEFSALK